MMISVYVPKGWHIFLPVVDAYSFQTSKINPIFFSEKFAVPRATIFRRLHYYFPGYFLKNTKNGKPQRNKQPIFEVSKI